MKENIKEWILLNVLITFIIILFSYLVLPHLDLESKPKVIEEHKVVNNYKETYQSIYGTYYKYYLVTDDGVFQVSDTEYYESTNTGVYKQWKTSN